MSINVIKTFIFTSYLIKLQYFQILFVTISPDDKILFISKLLSLYEILTLPITWVLIDNHH